MRSLWRVLAGSLALLLVGLGLVWTLSFQPEAIGTASRTAGGVLLPGSDSIPLDITVSEPITPTISIAVRDLPDETDLPTLSTEPQQRDPRGFVGPDIDMPPHGNPLVDLQQSVLPAAPNEFEVPSVNVAGVQSSSSPPDDTGDVGPNHYLQADNGPNGSRVTIYNKAGVQVDQFDMEDLASTSPCNVGYCDPIVIYDDLADRWMISEFDSSIQTLCVYVSTTPDPTGTWYAYAFNPPTSGTQDYPKYAVWPDGYYIGANNGGDVIVLERQDMINGLPATMQTFNIGLLPGFGFQLTVPASMEGSVPPAGAPAIYLRPRDTEIHGGTCPNCDLMEMWALHVDWVTPANSTLTALPGVQFTDWDQTLCGTGSDWSCMTQPGTSQALDPIREPIHFPLQYRNFGTHEVLVGCYAEDTNGSDLAGVHWFEIRSTPPGSGNWAVYQEGVLGNDIANVHRSVCSAAMDSAGNIAVGYTRTGSLAPYYPSIYYSGRRASDPLGTMPYYDNVIWDATTSKTNNERWGDYSGIGVDPSDGCTFWYTTEYGGSGQTRIAAFKFDECGTPDFTLDVSPNVVDACIPADAVFDVTIGSISDFTNPVTLSASGYPGGTIATFDPNPVTPPGEAIFTIGNTAIAVPGTYDITVSGEALDSPGHEDTVTLNLFAEAPAAITLLLPEDGIMGQAARPTFDWEDVAGATSYAIEIASDPDFTTIVASAAGLTSSTYTPAAYLPSDSVLYWRVTAVNACGETVSAVWAFRTAANPCLTYVSTDVPKPINDSSTTTSIVTVPDTFSLTDVNVVIDSLTHTYDGDLDIYIQHPDATQVELSTDNGGSGDNFTGTIFDDEATTSITAGSAPFTGSYRPEGFLSTLDSKPANGVWTLRVTDDAGGDTGTLNAWSLVVCGASGGVTGDYSDLPHSYGVAWHEGDGDLSLGAAWTQDDAFAPPGFDNISDDGVTFPDGLEPGQTSLARVNVQGTPVDGRWLQLWFDWNGDGIFGDQAEGEMVFSGAVLDGDNDISIDVPADLVPPVNYRARLYDALAAPARDDNSWGGASGGEVEDYTAVFMCEAGLEVLPATASGTGAPGTTVTYDLTVNNTGTCGENFLVSLAGNLWNTEAPLQVGPVAPGATVAFQVTVDIPADATDGETDEAVVTLASQIDPLVTDDSTLTTTAQEGFGVNLTTGDDSLDGLPGEVVTYTVTVHNMGSGADTFTLAASGNAWPVAFSETEVPLGFGESAGVVVSVQIPAGALAGATDIATITATSQGDPAVSDDLDLTTTALPAYGVSLVTADPEKSGSPGGVVEYQITVTNQGNITDTIQLTLAGNLWDVSLSETEVTLAAGASAQFTVFVTIPSDAAPDAADAVTITAASVGDPTLTDDLTLTTSASGNWIYLPILRK